MSVSPSAVDVRGGFGPLLSWGFYGWFRSWHGAAAASSSSAFGVTLADVVSALAVVLIFTALGVLAVFWVRSLIATPDASSPPVYDDFAVEADLFGDDDEDDFEHPDCFEEDGIYYDYSEYEDGYCELPR